MRILILSIILALPLVVPAVDYGIRLPEGPVVDSFPQVDLTFTLRYPEVVPKEMFRLKEDSVISFTYQVLGHTHVQEEKNVLILVENLRFPLRNRFNREVLLKGIPGMVREGDNFRIAIFDRVHNNPGQQVLRFLNPGYTADKVLLSGTIEDIPELPAISSYNNTLSYNGKNTNVESSDLYFAIYAGLKQLQEDFPGGNNFLVVFSAGFNNKNSGHLSTQTAMEFARRNDIPVYSVQQRIQGYEGHKLTELCYETYGGEVVTGDPAIAADTLAMFLQKAPEKKAGISYRFTYRSSFPEDGKLHKTTLTAGTGTLVFDYYTPYESWLKRMWTHHRYVVLISVFFLLAAIGGMIAWLITLRRKSEHFGRELSEAKSMAEKAVWLNVGQKTGPDRPNRPGPEDRVKQEKKGLPPELIAEMQASGNLPGLHYENNGSTGVFEISQPQVFIGRADDNDLSIADPSVSRRHLEIYFSGGTWFFRDLNSTAGTILNGEKLKTGALNHGDRIIIGNTELFFTH